MCSEAYKSNRIRRKAIRCAQLIDDDDDDEYAIANALHQYANEERNRKNIHFNTYTHSSL